MRPRYYGVKYYGVNDFSVERNLKKSVDILETFDENEEYSDINRVIELFNVTEVVKNVSYFGELEEKANCYKRLCSLFMKVVGKFFGKINDENFIQTCQSVCVEYIEDYWKLFVKFKVFKRISGLKFTDYLNDSETTLWVLLQQEELVRYYGAEMADNMRTSEQTPRLIISKFLEKREKKCNYHFPKELDPSEYEEILKNYINSENANLNYLQLLANAQNSKECPISDKLRLSAKRACNTYWEKHPFTSVADCGIRVEFADAPVFKSIKKEEKNTFHITYDIKWLIENLDYPTIMNNFRYVFEQFDDYWRSSLVSVESQLGIFERTLSIRGIKEYVKGSGFNFSESITIMQMKCYYDILKSQGIRLEDVFKWFFEEYLFQEFGASGFWFNPPSEETTLVEKCRNIASEMDGVLKQFRMFVQDGTIDRELFEMSSEHIIFSGLSGFIKDKYAYGNSSDIKNAQFLLFSDQSILSYTEKTKSRYSYFFELLMREDMKFSDFFEHQKQDIQWLMEHDFLRENRDNNLELNISKVCILKDLYEHDVVCPQYFDDELKNIIGEWYRNGDLLMSDTLFSKPEQDYLNYELNKSCYSNGLDLRNKYIHSTYPEDEETQLTDYMKLLTIMVLVITKINEEFCLREGNVNVFTK